MELEQARGASRQVQAFPSTPQSMFWGQLPALHVKGSPPQRGPLTHSQPAKPWRQLAPPRQSPPQRGAAEFAHAKGAGRQVQLLLLLRPHDCPFGQPPPQKGAMPAQEGISWHSQEESPASHLCPFGQLPPHVGIAELRT